MLSVHTSPLEQPGRGDAGGLNVYVDAVARRMARRGLEVEVFTRATRSDQPSRVQVEPGYAVRHVLAGPFGAVAKEDLPALLCPFASQVLRAATPHGGHEHRARFDVVHSHYWLSGLAGQLLQARWGIPLVHSAHTLARVKNAALGGRDDRREPHARELGEVEVVSSADVLVAPTAVEAVQLREWYGADPARIQIVPPGVDLEVFRPSGRAVATPPSGLAPLYGASPDGGADQVLYDFESGRAAAGGVAARLAHWGIDKYDVVLAFAGRIQPHKGPEVLVRALAVLRRRFPKVRFGAVIAGNSSGSGHHGPADLRELARTLGLAGDMLLLPALPAEELAAVYRAADVVAVPSRSESFGLVALEAQACGTPVVASRVGGLPVAVSDGVSGLLVDGPDPSDWADALASVALDPARLARMSTAARRHAMDFSWDATVDRLLGVYQTAATSTSFSIPSRVVRRGEYAALGHTRTGMR